MPDELTLLILSKLNVKQLSVASLVSKEWNRLASDYLLWEGVVKNAFSDLTLHIAVAMSKTILDLLVDSVFNKSDLVFLYQVCAILQNDQDIRDIHDRLRIACHAGSYARAR